MNRIYVYCLRLSLILLLIGLSFGLIGAFVFVDPRCSQLFPFERLRPLHVSSVVFWILTAATGGLFYYIQDYTDGKLAVGWLSKLFLGVWALTIAAILGSFLSGRFGGREYWEFPPILGIPLLTAWLLFAAVLFFSMRAHFRRMPVYVWMWMTGVIFFVLTFIESNLWLIPWFRDNIIRDIAIQWKSNGALVGSWNMLIYGTSFYLMEKISGNKESAHKPVAFFFYFLGLTNLLFNWGHHIYTLPSASWVRMVSYIISMTEWIVFINIIRQWKNSLSDTRKHFQLLPYRFLIASEFWVFMNLGLALLMSIPAINVYTHGTHVTVAHAMGTTIGINTMILLASVCYIFFQGKEISPARFKWMRTGYWLTQFSLAIFWLALVAAGIIKGYYTSVLGVDNFQEVMRQVYPALYVFAFAGIGLLAGLFILSITLLRVRI